MSGIAEPLINGFMLGVTAGPLCFTGCFPMLVSITLSDGRSDTQADTWVFIVKFISGRFIAYLGFGLLVGYLGSQLGAWNHKIGIYASIVLAFLLVAHGAGLRMPHLGPCGVVSGSTGNRYFPVILGGLSGLNLCPPFLLAITCVLQNSVTPAFGTAFFMSFFVATSLFIAPAGLSRYIVRRELIVRLGRLATVTVGIVFFYQGVSALLSWS